MNPTLFRVVLGGLLCSVLTMATGCDSDDDDDDDGADAAFVQQLMTWAPVFDYVLGRVQFEDNTINLFPVVRP